MKYFFPLHITLAFYQSQAICILCVSHTIHFSYHTGVFAWKSQINLQLSENEVMGLGLHAMQSDWEKRYVFCQKVGEDIWEFAKYLDMDCAQTEHAVKLVVSGTDFFIFPGRREIGSVHLLIVVNDFYWKDFYLAARTFWPCHQLYCAQIGCSCCVVFVAILLNNFTTKLTVIAVPQFCLSG